MCGVWFSFGTSALTSNIYLLSTVNFTLTQEKILMTEITVIFSAEKGADVYKDI